MASRIKFVTLVLEEGGIVLFGKKYSKRSKGGLGMCAFQN
jgi:hypothetical protein